MRPNRRAFRLSWLRGDVDREVEQELETHLGLSAEERESEGLDAASARRAAAEAFGDVSRYAALTRKIDRRMRRTRRRGEAMFRVRDDLRFALRWLRRSPGFTLVVVCTLALGIGANVAIFSVVRGVLLSDLPYAEPGRLVRLHSVWRGERQSAVSKHNAEDWRARSETIADLAISQGAGVTLLADEPVSLTGALVTANYFRVLGIRPALGRFFAPGEDAESAPPAVVLSWSAWQRYFGGDPGIVGETVPLDEGALPVIGVAPPGFVDPLYEHDFWRNGPRSYGRGTHIYRSVGRLSDTATLEQARAELRVIAAALEKEYPDTNTDSSADLRPIADSIVGDARPVILILFAAVGLVLLIACANVANLLLSRAATRSREFAVRAAIGAPRRRLVGQMLLESLLLAGLGTLLGLALAWPATRALLSLAGDTLPRAHAVGIDLAVLLFAATAAAATAVLFGLAPAVHAARTEVAHNLKGGGRRVSDGPGRARLRGALVVGQVALSLVLLTGAGLFLRTLWNLQSVDPGIDTRDLLTFHLSPSEERHPDGAGVGSYYERVVQRLAGIPGVEEVGAVNALPLRRSSWGNSFTRDELPPPEPGQSPHAQVKAVTPGYFDIMRMRVVRGRGFRETDDTASVHVAVVNEALADRYFPGEDPIGRRVTTEETSREIVGIVNNVQDHSHGVAPRPVLYTAHAQETAFWMRRGMWIVVRSAVAPTSLVQPVRRAVWEVDPTVPLDDVGTMASIARRDVAEPRFRAVLLGWFAGIAAVLAAIGIAGVLAYNVSQRRHELGVRAALGATGRSLLGHVVGQGLRLSIAGIVLGLASAAFASRLAGSLLYGVAAVDGATYVSVAALLLASASLATLVPAWRASRIDPIRALREE